MPGDGVDERGWSLVGGLIRTLFERCGLSQDAVAARMKELGARGSQAQVSRVLRGKPSTLGYVLVMAEALGASDTDREFILHTLQPTVPVQHAPTTEADSEEGTSASAPASVEASVALARRHLRHGEPHQLDAAFRGAERCCARLPEAERQVQEPWVWEAKAELQIRAGLPATQRLSQAHTRWIELGRHVDSRRVCSLRGWAAANQAGDAASHVMAYTDAALTGIDLAAEPETACRAHYAKAATHHAMARRGAARSHASDARAHLDHARRLATDGVDSVLRVLVLCLDAQHRTLFEGVRQRPMKARLQEIWKEVTALTDPTIPQCEPDPLGMGAFAPTQRCILRHYGDAALTPLEEGLVTRVLLQSELLGMNQLSNALRALLPTSS